MTLRAALAIGVGAIAMALTLGASPGQPAVTPQYRVVYAGDWAGPMEIFSADLSGRTPIRQLTFGRPAGRLCSSPAACGFTRPLPSPDGRWLAYSSGTTLFQPATLWLARGDGSDGRTIGVALDATWSPDSRRLAYSASDGVHVLTPGGANRIVDVHEAATLRYSPDGKALAAVDAAGLIVLRGGHRRVLSREQSHALAWSPDGKQIALATTEGISLVSAMTGRARVVYRKPADLRFWYQLELAFAPTGRLLAFDADGVIRLLDLRTSRVRLLPASGHDIAWYPNGNGLLVVNGYLDPAGDSIATGNVVTVTPGGRVRTVVAATRPYGGQIVSAAWTVAAPGLHYRAPDRLTGVFAGGPVQELAADGGRVAFIACGGVSVWTPAAGRIVSLGRRGTCLAEYNRAHAYSLALAGSRLAWVEKAPGLCFYWTAHEETLGEPVLDLGKGSGCLGSAPSVGMGSAVGAGSLLALSSWSGHYANGGLAVDEQTIERIEPGGCPCPVLSSTPGPYTPLDVDRDRILVSGTNETRVLAADGTILLALPVPTLAGQLSGSDLVLAAGGELRVYDSQIGSLRVRWPLPASPAGHPCDVYGDPSCTSASLVLDDVSKGLAAYVLGGEVHVLRLADGADRVVGPGTTARFADAGLVYADGARIRLRPYAQLPPG